MEPTGFDARWAGRGCVSPNFRAHRWRRQIESGHAKSITNLAEQEGVTDAYVCRLLPLTCLAPAIVEAIMDGRQPKGLGLAEMLGDGPLYWSEQRGRLGFLPACSNPTGPQRIKRAAWPRVVGSGVA